MIESSIVLIAVQPLDEGVIIMDWKKVEPGVNSETWKPEKEGDEIVGVLKDAQDEVGPNKSRVYTISTDDGTFSVWGSTVLDNRMKNVAIGEEVKIVYKGMAKSEKRKGAEYKDWDVFHRMPEGLTDEDIEDIF